MDFVEEFKLSLYAKEIFVFTPKGDLYSLPKGASALDFAFHIHTDLHDLLRPPHVCIRVNVGPVSLDRNENNIIEQHTLQCHKKSPPKATPRTFLKSPVFSGHVKLGESLFV